MTRIQRMRILTVALKLRQQMHQLSFRQRIGRKVIRQPPLELAIIEMALPAPSRTIPPKGATLPPAMTPELMRRYGMDNLPGPNPLAPDHTPK